MTLKYFDYESEELRELDKDSVDNYPTRQIKSPHLDYAGELYERVGHRFPVEWLPNAKAEPVVESGDLDDVSEQDVVDVLSGMKSEGIL